nr:hypothetical protein [Mesorhizobium sp.]
MFFLSRPPNSLSRSGNMAETHSDIAVEALTGFRQNNPFVLAHEQLNAEIPFQAFDGRAYGGLANAKLFGRVGETQMPPRSLKRD